MMKPHMRTISDFDLHRRVTLGNILDCSYDFRHAPISGRTVSDSPRGRLLYLLSLADSGGYSSLVVPF